MAVGPVCSALITFQLKSTFVSSQGFLQETLSGEHRHLQQCGPKGQEVGNPGEKTRASSPEPVTYRCEPPHGTPDYFAFHVIVHEEASHCVCGCVGFV